MQDFVVGKTATVIPRLAKQIQFIVIDKTKKSGQPHQLWARRFVVERYAEFLLKEPHCAGVTGLLQVSPPCRTMDQLCLLSLSSQTQDEGPAPEQLDDSLADDISASGVIHFGNTDVQEKVDGIGCIG